MIQNDVAEKCYREWKYLYKDPKVGMCLVYSRKRKHGSLVAMGTRRLIEIKLES